MIKKIVSISALGTLCAISAGNILAADWNFSGLVREEIAVKASDAQNMKNLQTNEWNGVTVANTGLGAGIPGNGTLTRPAAFKNDADFNMFATRFELNLDGKLSPNWTASFKLRGFTDQVSQVDNAFKGTPFKDNNLFEQSYGSNKYGAGIGMAGRDWMLDMPKAYLDYSDGPLWLRIGNQQIAWGEALFFRVADVANGLDLRRHSVLDVGAEEYGDKRVSSLAVRGTYRFNETTQLEGFVQQFSPTVLWTENSPYNMVAAQFVVDQKTGYDKVKDKFNFGTRFQDQIFGKVGVQAFAVRRYNPDGVFKWTEAQGPGAIAGTPFQAGTGVGAYSAQEWFHTASNGRFDGFGAVESAVNQFPGTQPGGSLAGAMGAVAAGCHATGQTPGAISLTTMAQTSCVLDSFFDPVIGFGNLRAWLVRDYPVENIFGFGLNTVFEGEPDSFTDQLIGRFELSHTPNKKFTSPTLTNQYLVKDETNFAFIFEKYHKFARDLPATYFVFQWMHKSATDLLGRALAGNNNYPGTIPTGKSGGSDNFAIVFQQPTPTLEFRFDFAAVTDMEGGWLVQPGMKWKLNKSMQLDVYGNYLRSSNKYRDFAQGLDYSREVFVRASLYF